jgi:hypothetical protein
MPGLVRMDIEVVDLGGIEVASFIFTQTTGARVGVVGVDAVSNSADG